MADNIKVLIENEVGEIDRTIKKNNLSPAEEQVLTSMRLLLNLEKVTAVRVATMWPWFLFGKWLMAIMGALIVADIIFPRLFG